jgi:hypothetical protein
VVGKALVFHPRPINESVLSGASVPFLATEFFLFFHENRVMGLNWNLENLSDERQSSGKNYGKGGAWGIRWNIGMGFGVVLCIYGRKIYAQ